MDDLSKTIIKKLSTGKPMNLSDMGQSLALVVPRVDFFLSYYSEVNNVSFEKCIGDFYKDGLNRYLMLMAEKKLLGNFGSVVNPVSYMCRFHNLGLDYYWIPKNACTFFKKNLALLDFGADELGYDVPENKFHETIQEKHGISMSEYIKDEVSNKKIAIVRDPIERIVSCYIDKFAKPCCDSKPYEPYIKNIIYSIYDKFNIDSVPENRSVSFSEFLFFIIDMPSFSYNEHWRPQADFIRNVQFDYIFRQEDVMDRAEKSGLLHGSLKRRLNSSVGLSYTEGLYRGDFSSLLPKEINIEEIEDYSQFVTLSQSYFLKVFYKEDIEIYNNAK